MLNDVTIIVDVDGTICPLKKAEESYADLIPYKRVVERMKIYKENGARIVLYTSRNMKTYQGNMGLINVHTAKLLTAWLDQWEIPYDEIIYGKPWPGPRGFYVDDRSVRPDEFLNYSFEQLEKICSQGRAEVGGDSDEND